MHFPRRAWLINASAFILLAVATQATAQFRPKITIQVPSDIPSGPANLCISDRTAVQFLTPQGALTPVERAQAVAMRLQRLIDSGADRRKLNVKAIGLNRADVVWGKSPVVVVTKREAMAHLQTPAKLANTWAANIRWLLAAPQLTVKPSNLVVPLGETRQITIGGVLQGPITLADIHPEVSAVSLSPDGRTLTVKGLVPGSNSVQVTRSGVSVVFDVSVRKYAGRLRQPSPVMVTGSPAPSEMCLRIADACVSRSLDAEPGAQILVLPPTTKLPDMPAGFQSDLTFPVRIQGEGYIPVAGSATVRVVNLALPKMNTAKLFYSNSPEQVKRFGSLFSGKLDVGFPDRLLYHHQNMMGKPFAFNIVLINAAPTVARVQIVKAAPSPLVDTVAVGYRAGVQFLPNLIGDIGEIVELPPMSRIAVCSGVVDKIYTASGIIQFRQLEGQPLSLRISADLVDGGVVVEGLPFPATQADGAYALSPWVYPSPMKIVDASYVVGKAWAFIRVGKQGIPDVTQEQQLYGNYGVLYDIRLVIANPTSERKSVDVIFESAAGLASGVFLIDGKYVKVTHIAPSREVPLARYTLAPNETKSISIKTVPLAGSSYPATILVRS